MENTQTLEKVGQIIQASERLSDDLKHLRASLSAANAHPMHAEEMAHRAKLASDFISRQLLLVRCDCYGAEFERANTAYMLQRVGGRN